MKYSSKIKWHTNFFWCKEADETTPGQADQFWELLTQWHSFWLLFFLTSFSTFIFISHFALIFLPIKWQLLTLLEITEYVQYNKSMMFNWINFVLFKITEFSFIISAYEVQNLMPLYPPAFLSSHLQNAEWIFMMCCESKPEVVLVLVGDLVQYNPSVRRNYNQVTFLTSVFIIWIVFQKESKNLEYSQLYKSFLFILLYEIYFFKPLFKCKGKKL